MYSIRAYNDIIAEFTSTLLEPVISTTLSLKINYASPKKLVTKSRISNKLQISIIVNLLFKKDSSFKITKPDLKRLFQRAALVIHLMSEGEFYDH